MATIKRCRAQLTLSGSWGSEHLWPGLDVDLDRGLVQATPAVPAKGSPGTDGYVPARDAVLGFTIREAIAGREDCFEDVPPEPLVSDSSVGAEESR